MNVLTEVEEIAIRSLKKNRTYIPSEIADRILASRYQDEHAKIREAVTEQ